MEKMEKTKVGIIYNGNTGADWAIDSFKREFEEKDIPVSLFDVNKIDDKYADGVKSGSFDLPELENMTSDGHTVWMNRIYPSEANFALINKGLNATSWLSARNFATINPLPACMADYDKKFAFDAMKLWGVNTPETEILSKEMDTNYLISKYGLPLIVKPNTGGTSIGVRKIDTESQLEETLKIRDIFSKNNLVQKFAKPIVDYDIRIGVVNGEPLISYARSLSKNGCDDVWMGSYSHGSKLINYEATEEQKRLAVLSSKSLGAILNEVDMQITEDGPVIIENNLTPGYIKGEEKWVKLIVDHIYGKYVK